MSVRSVLLIVSEFWGEEEGREGGRGEGGRGVLGVTYLVQSIGCLVLCIGWAVTVGI